MLNPVVARKMWRTLEPYHGQVYFSRHATDAYHALGLTGGAGYFASRAAALGPVPGEVVVALFHNFHPRLVLDAIPAAWAVASPEAVLEARWASVDATLREVLGEDVVDSADMAEAARLATRAAGACTPAGRALYAAHASLDWPGPAHLRLWHAVTLLREFRGDGHVAALVVEAIGPCESLVTHAAASDGLLPAALLQSTRGWPDEEWEAARAGLVERGWLDSAGSLTAAGAAARARVEEATDRLALAPWAALGEHDCGRLRALVRPWSRALVDSGLFGGPPG